MSAKECCWKDRKPFPYKALSDPAYLADKEAFFKINGNGWWYDWTKKNTPLQGVYSSKDDKRAGYDKRR